MWQRERTWIYLYIVSWIQQHSWTLLKGCHTLTCLCCSPCRKSQQSLIHTGVPPPLSHTRQGQTNRATMSLLSLTNPPGWSMCSALCILMVLLPETKADDLNATSQRNGGGSQCGEYTNQVMSVCSAKNTQVEFITAVYFFYCVDSVEQYMSLAGVKSMFHFQLYLQHWKNNFMNGCTTLNM